MTRYWTQEELCEAQQMRREGRSVSYIANALGRTYKAVSDRLNDPDRAFRKPGRPRNDDLGFYEGPPIAKTAEDIRLTTSAELGTAALGLAYAEFFKRHGITPEQAWRDVKTKSVGVPPSPYHAERKWGC